MHIAEGILPAEWCVIWAVPATVGVAAGLRAVRRRTEAEPQTKSLVALMGAAVFAISLMPIPVPVAGSSSHPAGTPLAAIVVGPFASILLAAIALLIQALFFAHGGLTTLGANIVSEGMVGSLVGFGVFWTMRKGGRSVFWAGFAAGILGDLAVYMTTASELSLGLFNAHRYWAHAWPIFLAFLPTQLPLAILEGIATGSILRSLAELRPDIATRLGVMPGTLPPSRARRLWAGVGAWWRSAGRLERVAVKGAGVLAALGLVWGFLWTFSGAITGWVGLDAGAMEKAARSAGRGATNPLLLNPNVGDLLLYVFFAGALVAGGAVGWLARGLLPPAARPRPRRTVGQRWIRLAIAAGVLGALVLWGALAPQAHLGVVSGGELRVLGQSLLHPTRQPFLQQRGGDVVLGVFMFAGLILGLLSGWRLRTRTGGRLRVRLPHFHLHDVLAGDRLSWQRTGLGAVDARVKLAALVVLLILNLLGGWVLSALMLAAGLVVLLGWQRVRPVVLGIRLLPAFMVGSLLILLRALTTGGHAWLSLSLTAHSSLAVTREGLSAGAHLALVVVTGVTLMMVMGLTTPLPRLLGALRWYRVPPLLIEIGLLMYRYLFLFVEEAGRMRQAQRLRGPEVPWRRAMGGYSSLGATLLARSYDRSQRVYDAQRLRGGS